MKICVNCQKQLSDEMRFCPHCGAAQIVPNAGPHSQLNEEFREEQTTVHLTGARPVRAESPEPADSDGPERAYSENPEPTVHLDKEQETTVYLGREQGTAPYPDRGPQANIPAGQPAQPYYTAADRGRLVKPLPGSVKERHDLPMSKLALTAFVLTVPALVMMIDAVLPIGFYDLFLKGILLLPLALIFALTSIIGQGRKYKIGFAIAALVITVIFIIVFRNNIKGFLHNMFTFDSVLPTAIEAP